MGSARRAARLVVLEQGWGWLVDDVSAVVSELATNAVLHARTGFTVLLVVERERLRVSVVDGSPVRPRLRRLTDPVSTTGRGLSLVAALSEVWGVTTAGDAGKETWCEFPLARPDAGAAAKQLVQDRVSPSGGVGEGDAANGLDVDALLAQFDDDAAVDAVDRLRPTSRRRSWRAGGTRRTGDGQLSRRPWVRQRL